MSIGNLSSKIRQMPSIHSIIMVAVLQIAINNPNKTPNGLDTQLQAHRQVLKKLLPQVLASLTFKHNPSAESGYYNILCADSNFSHCKPVLAAWLTDCREYSNTYHLEQHVRFWCDCPKNALGDYVPSETQQARRNHNLYSTLGNTNITAANAEHSSCHVHCAFKVF
jgi:hypothetical protein